MYIKWTSYFCYVATSTVYWQLGTVFWISCTVTDELCNRDNSHKEEWIGQVSASQVAHCGKYSTKKPNVQRPTRKANSRSSIPETRIFWLCIRCVRPPVPYWLKQIKIKESCNKVNTWLRNRIFKLNFTYFIAYSKMATGYREIKSTKILTNYTLNHVNTK